MSKSELQISRVTRSKKKAKASYDRISKWYDVLAGRFEKKYRGAGLKNLNAKDGEKVLEIGFGTGQCILSLAQSVRNSGEVYGIDLSEGMCSITRAKISRKRLSKRVLLNCGDAAKLPFKADIFDAIYMSFTLELFDTPEIPVVLNECQRILRRKSRISVVAMSKKKAGLMLRLYEWAHKKFPNYVDCRPIFVQRALDDAGFQVVCVTEMSMWGLPVEVVLARKP